MVRAYIEGPKGRTEVGSIAARVYYEDSETPEDFRQLIVAAVSIPMVKAGLVTGPTRTRVKLIEQD